MMEISDSESRLVSQVVARLKQIRKQKGILQESVLFDLGINIGRVESGRHCPTLPTLARLCGYYGATFDEFFREIEVPSRKSVRTSV